MDRGRRYHIREVLGTGGFGTVYRAEMLGEAGFRKEVALKVLHAGRDTDDRVARLRDEARILARLRHRALVGVDALIVLEGRYAIVMELVPGLPLDVLLRTRGPLAQALALEVVAEVASGLRAAHEATDDGRPLRLVHRDVKPANVILTPGGEIKLLDFGIARADLPDREAVTRNQVFGTPAYLAPERLELVDTPAGDVFALGVTLAELLIGDLSEGAAARPAQHEARVERLLTALAARGVAPEVTALVQEMTAYDLADRPDAATVERRARALRGRLAGPTLSAFAASLPPPPEGGRSGDLSGRTLSESDEPGAPFDAPAAPPPTADETFSMTRSSVVDAGPPAVRPAVARSRWPARLLGGGVVVGGMVAAALGAAALFVLALFGLWFGGVNRQACASTTVEMRAHLDGATGDTEGARRVVERVGRACSRGELGLVGASLILGEIERATKDGRFSKADLEDLERFASQYLPDP